MRDKLTLQLSGVVPLSEFAEAMGNFNALVNSLSTEIAGENKIEWIIEFLSAGSATASVVGVTEDPKRLAAVIAGYREVGKALQDNKAIPYSDKVSKPARSIIGLLNSKITSVRFETDDEEGIEVATQYTEGEIKKPLYGLGSIEGVVESLSRRQGLRFVVYDALFDRPVSCFLEPGQEDKIRDLWGKRVFVSGLVGRDGQSGKPFNVKEITAIKLLEARTPGSYKNASGVLHLKDGETPASTVRRFRDAQ